MPVNMNVPRFKLINYSVLMLGLMSVICHCAEVCSSLSFVRIAQALCPKTYIGYKFLPKLMYLPIA